MSRRGWVQVKAGLAGLAVFLVLLAALRLRGLLPFVAGAATYLALLWALRGERTRPRPVALPEGVSRTDYEAAVAALATASRALRSLSVAAPGADELTIWGMAERVEAIRRHHVANPAHVTRTRNFVRHTLPRMVAAVAGYVDLAQRAGPERDERLAGVARRLHGFVPVLERIDQACIDNDLMALEVGVEVLDEQLGRDRDA